VTEAARVKQDVGSKGLTHSPLKDCNDSAVLGSSSAASHISTPLYVVRIFIK
jgi:hypothetical protein